MKEYVVIQRPIEKLNEAVNALLKDGYEIVGSAMPVNMDGKATEFCQTLIKKS